MQDITTIGIIGLGSFGKFAASLLPEDVEVWGFDPNVTTSDGRIQLKDIETVATADAVILAVPLPALEGILQKLQPLLRPETLLVDICSVKVRPQALVEQYFGSHPNLLVTHPMFGPQSAATSTKGHKLVVTKQVGAKAEQAVAFCKDSLGLEIMPMTAEEHDKVMASVHVLTFFVARGLSNLNLPEVPFDAPSYKMIQDMVRFDQTHSEELFQTIQQGNPYAQETREQIVAVFEDLAASLKSPKGAN